jgi:hypothetical protein
VAALVSAGSASAQPAGAARALTPFPQGTCQQQPNDGQERYVMYAAVAQLNRWARAGIPAPSAPRIDIANGAYVTDKFGNALGRGCAPRPWTPRPRPSPAPATPGPARSASCSERPCRWARLSWPRCTRCTATAWRRWRGRRPAPLSPPAVCSGRPRPGQAGPRIRHIQSPGWRLLGPRPSRGQAYFCPVMDAVAAGGGGLIWRGVGPMMMPGPWAGPADRVRPGPGDGQRAGRVLRCLW